MKVAKKKTQSNEVSFSWKGKRPPFAFFFGLKDLQASCFFSQKMDHHFPTEVPISMTK